MIKKILWAILGIIIVAPVVAGIAGVKTLQFKAMGEAAAKMTVPPEKVNCVEVRESEWQPRIWSVGSVAAIQGIDVSTEADGVVRKINFQAGTTVTAGQELVQLDIDIEQAQLRSAEAAVELATVSFKRAKELVASKSISSEEYDSASSTLKQAIAQVDNLKAVIGKKTVRAPFAGKLGIRRISIGEYLQKGSPVVSLQALNPIFVEFSLPQQKVGEVVEGLPVSVTSDAYPGKQFEGKITAINADIDSKTRNLRLQATVPNPQAQLRPGMFVSLDVILPKTQKVKLIPSTAVQHAPYGDSVFVIDENKGSTTAPLILRQQFVRLGARQGDFVIATEGVKLGEKVVSVGGFKLRPGIAVEIDNKMAPDFKLEPKPKNT